jgi:hypothetical protein
MSEIQTQTYFNTCYTKEFSRQIKLNLNPFLNFDYKSLNKYNRDKNFIVAGDFVHDVLTNRKLHQLDFYVFTKEGFTILLDFFGTNTNTMYSIIKYSIRTHYIQITSQEYSYTINLINAFNTTPLEIMNRMDVDYLRCYYDGENINIFTDCDAAMNSQKIMNTYNNIDYTEYCDSTNICPRTLIKAIQKGYRITRQILLEVGIKFHDIPDYPIELNKKNLYEDEKEQILEEYDDQCYEYWHTDIQVNKEQLDFIYDTYIRDTYIRDTYIRDTYIRDTYIRDTYINDTTNSTAEDKFILYDVSSVKTILPYIYKNSIKYKINISCSCFSFNFQDMLETITLETIKTQ